MWTLVSPSLGHHIIGCKWVYRMKLKAYGNLDKYKARQVANGFNRVPKYDFTETFSPAVKPITIRMLLSLTLEHNWSLQQLDFKNTFLNGKLDEEVYMV